MRARVAGTIGKTDRTPIGAGLGRRGRVRGRREVPHLARRALACAQRQGPAEPRVPMDSGRAPLGHFAPGFPFAASGPGRGGPLPPSIPLCPRLRAGLGLRFRPLPFPALPMRGLACSYPAAVRRRARRTGRIRGGPRTGKGGYRARPLPGSASRRARAHRGVHGGVGAVRSRRRGRPLPMPWG